MFWPSSKEGQGVNVLKPNQRATVITLLERNTPQREIARITGIDRKTIRSYHARWLLDPANSPGVATVLDVNYPDRSATTILAGGSGG